MIGMLSHPFMAYAFIAGGSIAAASGLVGYFLVLRAQVFTADALSHVAFAGALAALAVGVDARLGLFTISVGVALGMGAAARRGRPDDVVTGGFFAWILGLGVFFLSLYTSRRSGGDGSASVSVLFGSIFGLSRQQVVVCAAMAAGICAAIVVMARPLLFTSLDEAVAATARVAGAPARSRLPSGGRADRGRGHPSGWRLADIGSAGNTGRRRRATDNATVPSHVAVCGDRRRERLDRLVRELPDAADATQLRDACRRHGGVPRRHRHQAAQFAMKSW
jgi:hypothetical protein